MRRLPVLVVTLVVVAVVATVTAAGAVGWVIRDNDTQARMGPAMMTPGSGNTPGWWDNSRRSTMRRMMGWAGIASEPEYLAEMAAHHQDAVDAARQLARSDRPELRAFGESIVKTQSAQIQQMQTWLEDWYPQRSTTVDYPPMMRDLSGLAGDASQDVVYDGVTVERVVAT